MGAIWRVVQMPGGPIDILKPPSQLMNEEECRRAYDDTMSRPEHPYAGKPYVDITPSAIPADRSKRYAWRLVGAEVVVDPTVPAPPHRRQTLLDAIDAATTVVEIKMLLRRIVLKQ